MPSNTDVVTEFLQAASSLDAEKMASYFTETGTYHNMPMQPVTGRDNVEKFIAGFLGDWTETTWEIRNISEQGDLVFCERLDRIKTKAGNVDLPCFGVFEMRDGKIEEWRDYFDLGTYVNAMQD